MSRLIVVSNRTPSESPAAGGVAVALEEVLKDRRGFWFGWSGKFSDTPGEPPARIAYDGVDIVALDLTKDDYEGYYEGYANRVLWPVFHHRLDLAMMEQARYEAYRRVNRQFAEALAPLLEPDDLIWVHDYQLIPLGEELRRIGVHSRIGFFLHIPFPGPEHLRAVPQSMDLMRALAAYDVIGLQTQRDVSAFFDFQMQHNVPDLAHRSAARGGHGAPIVAAFPIGTDPDTFAALAETPAAKRMASRIDRIAAGRQLIMGVDRIDYTKGLPQRVRAYEKLLANHADVRRKVMMFQVAPPSRETIPEYKRLCDEFDRLCGRVIGDYAEPDWVPLIHVRRPYGQSSLAGLYRRAEVALITPLRDGMNLVAHEYLASQDPENPGVLVLSTFAGAAELMEDALIVNPHDVDAIAAALYQALEMPHDERVERWQRLMRVLRKHNITSWCQSFVAALGGVGHAVRGIEGLSLVRQ